jgi:hypothetical protein
LASEISILGDDANPPRAIASCDSELDNAWNEPGPNPEKADCVGAKQYGKSDKLLVSRMRDGTGYDDDHD